MRTGFWQSALGRRMRLEAAGHPAQTQPDTMSVTPTNDRLGLDYGGFPMQFTLECEREDGRWLAEVQELPGELAAELVDRFTARSSMHAYTVTRTTR